MTPTQYQHIVLDDEKVPMVAGTRTKVVEIVLDHIAHGSDAEEIHRQYPYLTLGQIHSALAYYYDHQAEMDQDIEARWRKVEKIRGRLGDGPLSRKLKATALRP